MNNYYNNIKDTYNYQNNNYNKPLYTKNENPNMLFDPYAGYIRGNMFPNLYNDYKFKPYNIEPINKQAELLTYLDSYSFALRDINLYLDVYPDDRDMISLYNQYRQEENKLMEEYQNNYGPLLLTSNALNNCPWTWLKDPWPWEIK